MTHVTSLLLGLGNGGVCAALAIAPWSFSMLQAATATVRSIAGAGKRQPRPVESVGPLISLRDR